MKAMHVNMITEALRGCSVTCTIVYGDTTFTDCPNCKFDVTTGKSSGIYDSSTGTIPFTFGNCPFCHGEGRVPNEATESISLCPIYDYRQWYKTINSTTGSPDSMIQTMSAFSTYDDLKRAKYLIVDTAIAESTVPRFERVGEPEPCGLGASSFVITMWKRIQSG